MIDTIFPSSFIAPVTVPNKIKIIGTIIGAKDRNAEGKLVSS